MSEVFLLIGSEVLRGRVAAFKAEQKSERPFHWPGNGSTWPDWDDHRAHN